MFLQPVLTMAFAGVRAWFAFFGHAVGWVMLLVFISQACRLVRQIRLPLGVAQDDVSEKDSKTLGNVHDVAIAVCQNEERGRVHSAEEHLRAVNEQLRSANESLLATNERQSTRLEQQNTTIQQQSTTIKQQRTTIEYLHTTILDLSTTIPIHAPTPDLTTLTQALTLSTSTTQTLLDRNQALAQENTTHLTTLSALLKEKTTLTTKLASLEKERTTSLHAAAEHLHAARARIADLEAESEQSREVARLRDELVSDALEEIAVSRGEVEGLEYSVQRLVEMLCAQGVELGRAESEVLREEIGGWGEDLARMERVLGGRGETGDGLRAGMEGVLAGDGMGGGDEDEGDGYAVLPVS